MARGGSLLTKVTGTPREKAAAEAVKLAEQLERHVAEEAEAVAELEDMQRTLGETALEDPEAAGDLPRRMQTARDRAQVAAAAKKTAEMRRQDAAQRAVLAEAEEWDRRAAAAQRDLDEHREQVEGLLGQLRDLEGVKFAPQGPRSADPADVEHVSTLDLPGAMSGISERSEGPREVVATRRSRPQVEPTRSTVLQRAVWVAERTAWCLREVAAGRDPHARLSEPLGPNGRYLAGLSGFVERPADFYTESVWGPEALLPAPQYAALASSAGSHGAESAQVG